MVPIYRKCNSCKGGLVDGDRICPHCHGANRILTEYFIDETQLTFTVNPVVPVLTSMKLREERVVAKQVEEKTGEKKRTNRCHRLWTFDSAREFARSLNLKGIAEWWKYCRGKLEGFSPKPSYIPANPSRCKSYKGSWIDWFDWLGKQRTERTKRKHENKNIEAVPKYSKYFSEDTILKQNENQDQKKVEKKIEAEVVPEQDKVEDEDHREAEKCAEQIEEQEVEIDEKLEEIGDFHEDTQDMIDGKKSMFF